MPESLLRSKLVVPPLRPDLVPRLRLRERLDKGLLPGLKLTLVSAPAGYGKTTALAQWAHGSSAPIAWLSLDRSDNDFQRLFRYLAAAWEKCRPGVMESPLGHLLGGLAPDQEAVLTAFINLAHGLPKHIAFVLDDVHLLDDPASGQALGYVLDHAPPQLHFVFSGRGEPPLPLARYRAASALQELGIDDVRFRPEETTLFLNGSMALDLTEEESAGLQAQVEGWIAGLQLAGLALRRGLAPTGQPAVDGRQRFVADYFGEEVLALLPGDWRQFLLQTSILESMNGALCEAVTGMVAGQAMLERLERAALFVLPLDDRRAWFRYHPLFAELLQEELQRDLPEAVPALHRRAALWFLERDRPEPAFDHALASGDGDIVGQIADRYFEMMLHVRELKLLKRWLDAVPAEWHFDYPVIGLMHAGWLAITGSLADGTARVDEIERHLLEVERDDKWWQLARVNTVRCQLACLQGDLARAEPLAERALRDLPPSDHHSRANIHIALGDTYRNAGYWTKAKDHYLSLLALTEDAEYPIRSIHVHGALADLAMRRGRLHRAAAHWRQALAGIEARDSWGRLPLRLSGWVHIRMGEIRYEWNELRAAGESLSHGTKHAELGGDVLALIASSLLAGRLALAQGDPEVAAAHLRQARPLAEAKQFAEWRSRLQRMQLELWLAQDKLRAALNWCDEKLGERDLERVPEDDITALAIARVLTVRVDEPALEQALTLLRQISHDAEEEGRVAIEIEALALRALAEWQRERRGSAMSALAQSLRLAEPAGYTRLFADLGLPMARLLQEARARELMPAYVERLLSAFGSDDEVGAPPMWAPPEPLTERETQVLALLAAGLTNQEIAAELTISPLTVKTHASNIYGKLSVAGRSEAAARARELGLLR